MGTSPWAGAMGRALKGCPCKGVTESSSSHPTSPRTPLGVGPAGRTRAEQQPQIHSPLVPKGPQHRNMEPGHQPRGRSSHHALTFPIEIVVWDADVNQALEDLQGEHRDLPVGPGTGQAARSIAQPQHARLSQGTKGTRFSAPTISVFYDAKWHFSSDGWQAVCLSHDSAFLPSFIFLPKKLVLALSYCFFFLILQSTHPRFPKENQLNSEPLAKFLSPHNVMINIPIASAKKATNNPPPGQTIAFFFIYLALPASHIY